MLKSRAPSRPLTSDAIHDRLLVAILERRLPPGTQLVETQLARVFSVSRTKIREAIGRLTHDRIAIDHPNRGAFVATPTAQEARDVFSVRRLIEPEIVRQVCARAGPRQLASLRAHLAREARARDRGGAPHRMIRLSGEFHLLLAGMAGNDILARTLRELESLTALVISHFDAAAHRGCRTDEHGPMVDAIEAGDADRAARLMLEHLGHIEQALDLEPAPVRPVRLEDVFR